MELSAVLSTENRLRHLFARSGKHPLLSRIQSQLLG